MARLIIGHTSHNSTRIWIRGDDRFPTGFVTLQGPGKNQTKTVHLEQRHFFTGIAEFTGLTPSTDYDCSVEFGEDGDSDGLDRVSFGDCSGKVTTFPSPNAPGGLTFLLGSCNLHSLGLIQRPGPAYRRLAEVAQQENAAFMVHCGDQIYYDVPNGMKRPDIDEYRQKYLDAWQDSRRTRKFLTMLPQFMILDDHELVNNFANDMDSSSHGAPPDVIKEFGLKVYREFVHIRHATGSQRNRYGDQALYYDFQHGEYPFFVLDTRTERYERPDPNGIRPARIIGETQMSRFLAWLKKYPNELKFAVSSVPFVGEAQGNDDKWNGQHFRKQREQIMAYVLKNQITGLVFLTGDMHCSYHAEMNITAGPQSSTVHELMASPINQIGKRSFDAFVSGKTRESEDKKFKYVSRMKKSEFYDDHSNAMLIDVQGRTVDYEIFRTKKDKRAVRSGSFTA